MALSLNQAARQGKVAKTTLQRALKSGEISGSKSEKGQWQIDPSELGRWIGTRSTEQDDTGPEIQDGTPKKLSAVSTLEREIELLRERLDDKDDTIHDLRDRLDREAAERQRLTAILTDQREKPSEPAPEPQPLTWRERFTGKRKRAS